MAAVRLVRISNIFSVLVRPTRLSQCQQVFNGCRLIKQGIAPNRAPPGSGQTVLRQLKSVRPRAVFYGDNCARLPNRGKSESVHWKVFINNISDIETAAPIGNAVQASGVNWQQSPEVTRKF
jgi:hypothetical protein